MAEKYLIKNFVSNEKFLYFFACNSGIVIQGQLKGSIFIVEISCRIYEQTEGTRA